MPFIASSRKRIGTALLDDTAIGFDLISQLTYMSAVAASGVARDMIMEEAGQQPFRTAIYFRNVFLLVKRMGMEYTRAFQVIAQAAPTEGLRHLLLRFSGAVATGGSEADFIRAETRVEMERYSAAYDRTIESLRKWSDAYASLLVSATLIVVVTMVSTMLYSIDKVFLLMLGGVTLVTVGLGVFVIFRVAPVEQIFTATAGSRARRFARSSFLVLGPIGLVAAIAIYPAYQLGGALLVLGLSMIPTGILASMENKALAGFDRDLPNMIRSLGNMASALGSSPGLALEKIDRRALGRLEAPVKRLQVRLAYQLNSEACWSRLCHEVGSELVRRSIRTFLDAVRLGAAPERAGEICGDFSLAVTLMREKRSMTASTFSYLAIALHAAMAALLAFVLQIVLLFNGRVAALAGDMAHNLSIPGVSTFTSLPFFTPKDVAPLVLMTHTMIVTLTLANAIAPKSCAGGHPLGLCTYAAPTFILSGVVLLVVPQMTSMLFKI